MLTRPSPRFPIAQNPRARRNDRSMVAVHPRRDRYRVSDGPRNCFASSVSIDDRAICNNTHTRAYFSVDAAAHVLQFF